MRLANVAPSPPRTGKRAPTEADASIGVAKTTATLRAMFNNSHNVITGAFPVTNSETSHVEGYVGDRTDRIEPAS
jgi:hypothetical protein